MYTSNKMNKGNGSMQTTSYSTFNQDKIMEQLILLTAKYEHLEKKMAKIEKACTVSRRKNITEYLTTLRAPALSYSSWLSTITVSDAHLEKLFAGDLKICIKEILEDILDADDIPLYAFRQKQNTIYMYDDKWRLMTTDEFARFVSIISHRVVKKYTGWALAHKDEFETDQKSQDKAMHYMSKAHGLDCSVESRTNYIKKWIFTKINVSLSNHELLNV